MMRVLIFLLLCAVLPACRKSDTTDGVSPRFNPGMQSLQIPRTWLAMGDSYTVGQGVAESLRFPAQAVALLEEKNIRIDTVRYSAYSGWTSFDLLLYMLENRPRRHGVVTLLIGVNDQYRRWDSAGFRVRFRQLLDMAMTAAEGDPKRVFVLSIPDYAVTPYARKMDTVRIRREIDLYNGIKRMESEARGCRYIDITEFTRQARENPRLICGDSLHPSEIEYRRWADLLMPHLEETFR